MAEKTETHTHTFAFWKRGLPLLAVLMPIFVLVFSGIAFGHDRTVNFRTSDPGVSRAVENWGLDTAWYDGNNVRRGAVFMGPERVDIVRISFTPTAALVNGNLQTAELNMLNQRLNWVDSWTTPNTVVCINEDSPTVDPYFVGSNGYIDPARWAELIDVTAAHAQARGRTVVSVAPFNEPDLHRPERLANMQTFYNTAGVLLGMPRFSTIRISGGNTLNTDQANPWYNNLKARLDEGCTHQLAGNFNNYASFFQNVRASGHHATNDELHNVMEAMVGAEYGMQTGIWWYTAERARGEFVKASDGQRLGYAEHRTNWTAASVYRAPDGQVQAFVGESERQARPTTYRFVSLDRNVFYDGYGPQREYILKTTGGSGYQTEAHRNAEKVVNITWGDDIQPVVDGRYVVVNRKSRKVMEVAGGAAGNGTNIQQNAYNGQTYQQWDINPLPFDAGEDYSYHRVIAVHSQKAPDVYNFSLNDGGDIRQWDYSRGRNQQWFFEYVEDGWFYIRSRWSGKYLNVSGGSTNNGANIQQYSLFPSDPHRQQWRLIPVGANPADVTAPAVPSGVAASANPVSVQLTWNANTESDLAGYTVLRSTTSGGPYEMIARGITTASFTDNTAIRSIPYYYVVRAVDNSLNRSALSEQVSATPTGVATLVAQYGFDGNMQDASINANHGVINGSVGYGTGIVGSNCLVLDGSSGYVSLPAEAAHFDAITIAAWVNWSGGSSWQRIFDFGNDTDYNMFLTPRSGSGTLRFSIKNGGAEQIVDTAALQAGTWTHVAVTLSGTTAILYVNGAAVASNNAMTIKPSDFSPVCNYLGKSQWSDPLFNGQIDDFRIYNYALSAGQIAEIPHETPEPSPWEGVVRPIPGLIQAEHFDLGGPGVAYYDTTLGNSGGQYRPYDSVDIFTVAGGFAVGDIQTGEWLSYTVNSTAGQTSIYARVASVQPGSSIQVLLDDELLGTLAIPNTGSLTSWTTVSVGNVTLPQRENAILKLVFTGSGFLLDSVIFSNRAPFAEQPCPIPGRIEFEDFDIGGQQIAYFDKTTTNGYGQYRPNEAVDIMMIVDGGVIGYAPFVETSEWMEYTCAVAKAGNYTVVIRSSSPYVAQQMTLEIAGQPPLATFTLPHTNGFFNFVNTSVAGIYLPAGEQVLRFTMVSSSGVVNYVDFIREYHAADITRSGRVDLDDFAILAAQWLGIPGTPSADIAPAGGDGSVDMLDLTLMAESWLYTD